MLVIRMQRTGRKGHAQFRVVVQDSRRTPTSGKVVAQLGNFDPHTKVAAIDKDKATFYLTNGAQPSPRAARLLEAEGVKLPSWVKKATTKDSKIRNPEKLRRNNLEETPKEEAANEAPAEAEATEATPAAEEAAPAEAPADVEPAAE